MCLYVVVMNIKEGSKEWQRNQIMGWRNSWNDVGRNFDAKEDVVRHSLALWSPLSSKLKQELDKHVAKSSQGISVHLERNQFKWQVFVWYCLTILTWKLCLIFLWSLSSCFDIFFNVCLIYFIYKKKFVHIKTFCDSWLC